MARSKRSKEEQRRYNMSRIKSKDTKIEVSFRKALWHRGIRYRKNYRLLPGSPDIAITKSKIAIFCDGEFWHGKDWPEKKGRFKSNPEYWVNKIEKNMRRDSIADRRLDIEGWVVLRFWGDELQKNLESCVEEVIDAIAQAKINNAIAKFEKKSAPEKDE